MHSQNIAKGVKILTLEPYMQCIIVRVYGCVIVFSMAKFLIRVVLELEIHVT